MVAIRQILLLLMSVAAIWVLVLMFQTMRGNTTLAKLRLLSRMCWGLAGGWILMILLGDKTVFMDAVLCLLNGWLGYSYGQTAAKVQAFLEAQQDKPSDDGDQDGGQDSQPPGS